MSTRDPALPRTGRFVLAAVLYLLTLVAAGACVWGWSAMASPHDGDTVPAGRALALIGGQLGSVGGFVATAFALPRKHREGRVFGYLLAGVAAAAAAGFLAAGAPRVAAGLAVVAVLVVALVWWLARRGQAREELRAQIRRTGRRVAGEITEVTSNSRVNGVPRWRIVVKFVDAAGTTRWLTTHRTTYSPPQRGWPVGVHYDPDRPGDQRRIVVDF